jgi:DNA-directed RNA polymerase specialized sigma24 family protein
MTSNAVRQLDERQRALKVVELRVQGHTYAQIAAVLDYSDGSGARLFAGGEADPPLCRE